MVQYNRFPQRLCETAAPAVMNHNHVGFAIKSVEVR